MPDRPRVLVSFAQSLDGRIATCSGDSQWISGSETLTLAHQLRRDSDAILVGIGTVLRDDPELSCRLPGVQRSPLRVILDSRLQLPERSKIVQSASRFRSVVITAPGSRPARRRRLEEQQITVLETPRAEDGIDLAAALRTLAELGVRSVLVEGGSAVITSFVRRRLVDRMIVVIAPLIIGDGTQAVGDLGFEQLEQAIRLKPQAPRQYGADLVWELEFPCAK